MSDRHTPKRLTDHQVERLIGQTPCLCGSMESWHDECYRGKSEGQIKAAYRIAFKKVRQTLHERFESEASAAIAKASTAKETP